MADPRAQIRGSAASGAFRRGEALARAHGVLEHTGSADTATGRVAGSDGAYRVEVTLDAAGLGGQCECIARMSVAVCKHMVALALVAFAETTPRGASLDQTIAGLPPTTLVGLLADLARRDPAVRRRVEAMAAALGGDLDVRELGRAITRATTAPRDPSWRGAIGVADRAQEVLGLLRGLVDARAPEAPGLVEHLIGRIDRLLGRVDDSGGHLGTIQAETRDLHLAACQAAPPSPAALARTLVGIASGTEWDWVHDAPERYREILGPAGLDALDRAIAKSRVLEPPAAETEPEWVWESHTELTLQMMAESSARARGDPDRIVEVLAADLRSARRYVQIADALDAAGREREALVWLERGRAAHGCTDDLLRASLYRAYLRDGSIEDALALAHEHLTHRPTARAFVELREVSGHDAWPTQRAWALQVIAEASIDEHVLALIADQQVRDALVAARDQTLFPSTRRALARAAARADIEQALDHYTRLLEESLTRTGRGAYGDAIRILREMHEAAGEHGRAGEVTAQARTLRETHRRRPALAEMLDGLRWW